MANHIILINGYEVKLIPLGKCMCGCGGDTKIATRNWKAIFHHKGQSKRYILGHNSRGDSHPSWKGGRIARKHIKQAEEALGKSLPKRAVVHHFTEDQLVICQDQSYHILLHQRQRAFEACGHANWLKCVICKKYDDPINLYVPHRKRVAKYHRSCYRKYRLYLRNNR